MSTKVDLTGGRRTFYGTPPVDLILNPQLELGPVPSVPAFAQRDYKRLGNAYFEIRVSRFGA